MINHLESNYLTLDIVDTEKYYLYCDVKKTIDIKLEKPIDIIYNLAAIHKTPGHAYSEYFKTNINGAENVCDFTR